MSTIYRINNLTKHYSKWWIRKSFESINTPRSQTQWGFHRSSQGLKLQPKSLYLCWVRKKWIYCCWSSSSWNQQRNNCKRLSAGLYQNKMSGRIMAWKLLI